MDRRRDKRKIIGRNINHSVSLLVTPFTYHFGIAWVGVWKVFFNICKPHPSLLHTDGIFPFLSHTCKAPILPLRMGVSSSKGKSNISMGVGCFAGRITGMEQSLDVSLLNPV